MFYVNATVYLGAQEKFQSFKIPGFMAFPLNRHNLNTKEQL